MLTGFVILNCPSKQRRMIEGDIKPAPVDDTTGMVNTVNLNDRDVPVPELASTAPLQCRDNHDN